jgi:hypothetical protein
MSSVSLTFSRSWLFNANNLSRVTTASALAQNQRSVLAIKNVLLGGAGQFGWTDQAGAAATAPTFWTVDYSATNLVAGAAGDGVDRWSVYTDLVWNASGAAHSWIVLKNASGVAGATLYWLIALENSGSDSTTLDMWTSKVGFTGGSTTLKPTATDQCNMLASTFWGSNSTPIRFHVLMSTDGRATRVFTNYQTTQQGAWFLETMLDAATGVEYDLFNSAFANASGNAGNEALFTQTPRIIARKTGGPSIYGVMTGEGSRYAGTIQAGAPAVDRSLWSDVAAMNQLSAVGASGTLAGGSPATRGHIGSLVDLWWGSNFVPSGRSFPSGYERQIATMGPLVIPWNSTKAKTF